VWVAQLDSPHYFFALVAGAALVGVLELFHLAAVRGVRPQRPVGLVGVVLMAATFLENGPDFALVLAACVAATVLTALWSRQPPQETLSAVVTTLFGIVFVGLLLGYQVGLRSFEGVGAQLVYFLWWVVWSADAAAYGVGTLVGRKPIAPRVSPRKTLEGTLAGFVAAVAAAWIGGRWLDPALSLGEAGLLGVLLGGFGLLGDLSESLLKRGSQVKDSGAWLPGHGGVLDRTDSLLFTAPVLFYYWKWFRI
jgi:phosphatidate cytidylyltransferase